MKNHFAISSEIQISTRSSWPLPDTDSIERAHLAAAVVDLLQHAGLDCYLVVPDSDHSLRMDKREADDPQRQQAANRRPRKMFPARRYVGYKT